MIQEKFDRWIVQPRHVRIEAVAFPADDMLEVRLETELRLEIVGQWILLRSVAHVDSADLQVDPVEIVGAQQNSLVLFDSGSIRLVLSNGIALRASAEQARQIRCYRPGDFEWVSQRGHVERNRHVA